jgi:hypothetical protein
MDIPFGEYLPDLPSYKNPGLKVATNVLPQGPDYGPFLSPVVYSSALEGRCQGAVSTKDKDGNTSNYAGDATKLYKMAATVYGDASLAGGYSTLEEELWSFTRFNDHLIATNFSDYPQKVSVFSGGGFSNLTTELKARYVTTINSFVVFGNTFDLTDGNVPHRVRWSALNDDTDYVVDPSTQSDFQDLDASKGWVRQVVGGEVGIIFQEQAISRMSYVGSPTIWRFDEVESGKGTKSPGSVVKVGNIIFYLGLDGFYAFDGGQSIPIGANKVDKTFFSEVDTNYIGRVSGTADLDNQVVYWAYAASGNTNGLSNKILAYNYSPSAKTRWTQIEPGNLETLYTSLSEGFTLETLDSISSNLDTLPFSLDSRVWTGENFILSGFNADHKQVNFTGSALTARLEPGEIQPYPSSRSLINLVRPIVEGTGTMTIQMGTRNLQSESVTYGSAVSANSTGNCPVRSNARYQTIRLNISGGFEHAQGIEIPGIARVGVR